MTFDLLQGFQHMLMQHGSTSHSPGHHWLHSRSSRQVHVKTEIPQIFAAHLDCLLFPIACSGASTRRFPARRCLPPVLGKAEWKRIELLIMLKRSSDEGASQRYPMTRWIAQGLKSSTPVIFQGISWGHELWLMWAKSLHKYRSPLTCSFNSFRDQACN